MNLACSVINEYWVRYTITVIHFYTVGYEPRKTMCQRPAMSSLKLTNITLLMDLVEKGFGGRKKYLIVVEATDLIQSPEFRLGMSERTRLGFTRWLWRTPFEDAMSITTFNRYMLCFSMFLDVNETLNGPADFLDCNRRRTLTVNTLKLIETFPSKSMTILCQEFCADMPNAEAESSYMTAVMRFMNLSSWKKVQTHEDGTFEEHAREQLRRLRLRLADFSMTPSPITYDKLKTTSQSLPQYFFESRLLTWRLDTKTMGGSGMFGMLDEECWAAMVLFVLCQIAIYRCAFCSETSDALCRVFGVMLWQSCKQKRAFLWKLNAASLYLAAFLLGAIFRNALISCLNVRFQHVINTGVDLREAIEKKQIDQICVPQFSHYMSEIGQGINKHGVLEVLEEISSTGALYVPPKSKECVNFWLKKESHAAYLVRPFEYLTSQKELASVHMSYKSGPPIIIGKAHAPWHHQRKKLNLLSLLIFENVLFYDYPRTIRATAELLRPSFSPASTLKLSDVNVAFIALASTFFFLCSHRLYKHLKMKHFEDDVRRGRSRKYLSSDRFSRGTAGRMIFLCKQKSREMFDFRPRKRLSSSNKPSSGQRWKRVVNSPEFRAIREDTLRSIRMFPKHVYSESRYDTQAGPTAR